MFNKYAYLFIGIMILTSCGKREPRTAEYFSRHREARWVVEYECQHGQGRRDAIKEEECSNAMYAAFFDPFKRSLTDEGILKTEALEEQCKQAVRDFKTLSLAEYIQYNKCMEAAAAEGLRAQPNKAGS